MVKVDVPKPKGPRTCTIVLYNSDSTLSTLLMGSDLKSKITISSEFGE